MRLGLWLDTSLSQGFNFLLRAGYQKTWLNCLGAEMLVTGEIGRTSGASVEFYQPLNATQRYFIDATAEYKRERADYFSGDQRLAEYRISRRRLDLVAGINFDLYGQLRAGWRESKASKTLDTGIDLFAGQSEPRAGGWLVGLDIGETPFGPVYVGLGRGSGGTNNAYLFIGTP